MPKYVICTVGTSIAYNLGIDMKSVTDSTWDDPYKDFESNLFDKLGVYIREHKGDINKQRDLSAEINSLCGLKTEKDDRISLLASDTAQGHVCAKAVKECLIKWYGLPESSVKIERIADLQVYDQKRLETSGLTNLISKVIEVIEVNEYQYEIIINPTGGYKSFVPFMTVIGMLFGKKIVYIFENSKSLLSLPPLPVSFDLDIFDRAYPALELLKNEGVISKGEYIKHITDYKFNEENLFMSFVEADGNDVTISSLAFVLLKVEEENQKPYVHKQIMENLKKNVYGNSTEDIKRMISRVASPLLRPHSFSGTDLSVYKQGNTANRIAFFRDKGDFYVTHAFSDHDDYERVLNGARKEKYTDKSLYEQWK